MKVSESMVFTATDMENVTSFDLCGGSGCIFTVGSPGKATSNEDSVALIPCGSTAGVFIVADGLGGMYRGDLASKEVVNTLVASIEQDSTDCGFLREAILDGVEMANNKISANKNGAASTAAILEIQNGEVRPYHAGDSVILITGQRGRIKYQTIPHSPVGYAVESGILAADDAIYHDERHLVSNAVGMFSMYVEVGSKITLADRDTVLVASDGLFDNLYVNEIVTIICQGSLQKAAETLVSVCLGRMETCQPDFPHKPDDMSFILFRLE